MITLFLLFTSFAIAGTVLSVFWKIAIFFFTLFFEILGFVFLVILIGGFGIFIFAAIDFLLLKAIIKI